MPKERISYLLQKYSDLSATKAEEQELFKWVNENPDSEPVHGHIQMLVEGYDSNGKLPAVDWEKLYQQIREKSRISKTPILKPSTVLRPSTLLSPSTVLRMTWYRVAAAVAVVLLLSVGGYFYFTPRTFDVAQGKLAQRFKNDVAPGGNKAVLTLANGSQIILDSAANGTLTQQGNTKIIKLDSGQLAYNAAGPGGEILYNTISTPKGGQYQIVLADGSKVWLNAASSLRFPTSFNNERNVELTGEGYFEIAHDATKPFNVSVNGMNVQVLGTHFNINAYDDESVIKTTLLEGSVKVTKDNLASFLKPGQQAQLTGNEIKVENANMDEVMAWKDGRFQFKRTDIKTIMRQLSRWYDLQVVYKNVPATGFNAKIPRNIPVSNILKVLELTGEVKFSIDGKTVTVM